MPSLETRRIRVEGQVQGVGFRPFVYRQAVARGLTGEVINGSSHVSILVRGAAAAIDDFVDDLTREAPGVIERLQQSASLLPVPDAFRIGESVSDAGVADVLLTDRAICQECLAEFNDPAKRRYGYPFISCPSCGPRYSVCRSLPYDRTNTSWQQFPPCPDCLEEVATPGNRRFHQVAVSCPDCGPEVFTPQGSRGDAALKEAAETLASGGILAFKGDTGFQLLVDADNPDAIARLRERKRRSKPLAVLAPSLDWVGQHAQLDLEERQALASSAAPLVLLQSSSRVAENVAPGTGMLAVMLPHSALQVSLMQKLRRPLVATSGNLSGSPLIYKDDEALPSLAEVADCMLLHNLELCQGLDDSVVRVMAGEATTLRLGRGLAPDIHRLPDKRTSMGCGAHMKSSIALHGGGRLIAGPYIGDLDSAPARYRHRQQKQRLQRFFQLQDASEVTDLHPDYGSTIDADYRANAVPHHVAHAMAAWQEQQPAPPFLVLTWDGVGLGPDGTIWGGECLLFEQDFSWHRVGSVRPFPLPRTADIARFPGRVARILAGAESCQGGVQSSSMGRLIEGLGSLAGLREENAYEAQVAMEWEALGWQAEDMAAMEFEIDGDSNLDWRPLLPVLSDSSIPLPARSAGFHRALAQAAVRQCRQSGVETVLLSGGVFQNRLLVETLHAVAAECGLKLLTHRRIPPNDGGIALGQCVALAKSVHQAEEAQRCA